MFQKKKKQEEEEVSLHLLLKNKAMAILDEVCEST